MQNPIFFTICDLHFLDSKLERFSKYFTLIVVYFDCKSFAIIVEAGSSLSCKYLTRVKVSYFEKHSSLFLKSGDWAKINFYNLGLI